MTRFSENWNDEQRDSVFDAIVTTLDGVSLPWQTSYVEEFIDRWFEAKLPLLELLSNHPNWSQEDLAVVQDVPYVRKLDIGAAKDAYRNIYEWVDNYCRDFSTSGRHYCSLNERIKYDDWEEAASTIYWGDLAKRLPFQYDGTIKKDVIEYLKYYGIYDGKATSIKLNTVFRRHFDKIKDILDEWGYYNKENGRLVSGYEYYFNILANALKPTEIMRKTLVSLHPADFLRMSYGNTWDSCHTLPDGGWSAGCFNCIEDKACAI